MHKLFFHHALLPDGWHRDVLIEHSHGGTITRITANAPQPPSGVDGQVAVPGMANLHSHAFQRAMAGLTEWRGEGEDSFWSWRDVMYRFIHRLRPQDVQAIAALAYTEMLESGFTAVGEFHYLHHQPDGTPYDNIREMAEQLAAAAAHTGIGHTLLPVLYMHGGFGGAPLQGSQHCFANDTERFLQLVEACRTIPAQHTRTVIGVAPHSLRAVTPEALNMLVQAVPAGPIHIHIAEQTQEVEDCLNWSGARPVQWLFDHQPVDARWCLIHATHMEAEERNQLARSGAVAGLCPLTEANLGDGIVDGAAYHHTGGRWGIGSDSHIRIDLAEELRLLEYSQRLRDRQRNRMVHPGEANGKALFSAALAGGAQALGQPMGAFIEGNWCDVVSLDVRHPALIGKQGDDWLNGWIFTGDKSCVRDVWSAGRHVVQEGWHEQRTTTLQAFTESMEYLLA